VTRFRDELWPQIDHIYAAIGDHPFVRGLTTGTLGADKFAYYVVQDAHYLRDYARALAITGARADTDQQIVQFCQDAAGAIVVERSLHEGFLGGFGLTPEQAAAEPVSPTTLAYTSYLLRVAHQGSYAEAVAAVLPCYWIYARVGDRLLAKSSPNPLYQRWIDTYGGVEFQSVVSAVLEVVDALGTQLTPAQQRQFTAHVVTTSRYEWLFFDAAWRLERWPEQLTTR
jgi:thiaminase/transcriptional activator TenA